MRVLDERLSLVTNKNFKNIINFIFDKAVQLCGKLLY